MTFDLALVLIIISGTFGLMVWEKFSPDVVAMLAFSALLISGILTPPSLSRACSYSARRWNERA